MTMAARSVGEGVLVWAVNADRKTLSVMQRGGVQVG